MNDKIPSAQDIATTRAALLANKTKVRASGQLIINTATMKARTWPTIETWVKAKRRYLPLCIGQVWRYETTEDRDAVLRALQSD